MKVKDLFIVSMLSLLMLSCNEKNKPIKPVSGNINGPLGDYFQVVQCDYVVQDGRITLDFMRVKEGWPVPMKTDAPLGDCDECFEPSFMAEFMDEEGCVLAKSSANFKSALEQIAVLMAIELDEVGSLSFTVPTKGVCQVKLLSDFVYHGTATSNLRGTVNGAMDILMSLEFTPQGEAKGGYYHRKFGPDALLCLVGVLDEQDLTLTEYSTDGKRIGCYKGTFKEGSYVGNYESFDGKNYDFSLTEDPTMEPVEYSEIDFASFGDEPAYIANNQEDYEDFYQAMFENQGILLSVKDTMQLTLNKNELELTVGDCDTLVMTSHHLGMPITWSSSDESVAMVGSSGVVCAISEGEAFIMATVQPTKRDTVTTKAYVKVNPEKKKSVKTPKKSSSIDLGYATYEPLPQDGMTGVKNGQPHGNGIMRFKSSHIIPGTQDCTAEAGEWVNGAWRDGKINVGTWYRNDGNQVIVKLGQRYNR
jgi:hypothetical protein